MEIDITHLLQTEGFDTWNLSNSRANLGQDAGRITWRNSCEVGKRFALTPEQTGAFKDFVEDSGGWTKEEIAAWSQEELQALFVQWVAGDIRECFGYDAGEDFSEWGWAQYEEDSQAGRIPSNLFQTDGKLYFSLY